MKKKVLSLVLSASMVSSMLPAMAYAADGTTTFPDMPNDWSTTALQSAIDNGLLNGIDGKIAASENLTRAQMAAIVTRAFGTNGNADISGFGDVNSGDWFYNAMAAAVNMGAFQGDGTGLNPNANITRQEAFTVLARLFTLSGADQSVLNSFSDAGQVADWAKDSMASMVQAGYVSGDRNMLKPTSSITRAEFAQVMYNLLSDYMVAGEDGTNVQGNAILNQTGTLSNVTVSGDLIVGDGAGEGDVTLNNVTVSGRLLVRGGGVNTVTLEGNTTVGGQIVVNKPTGDVRVHNSTSNEFDAAVISDGATLTGEFDVVEVTASGTTTVTGATVNTVNVSAAASLSVTGESKVDTVNLDAASSKLNVNGNSTVTTVNVPESASNASIDVANGSTVTNVNTAANGVSIDGEGKVSNVKVEGNNTSVDTVGTKVTVASGVTGTTSNGKDIAAGTTVTTTANGTTGGGSTGGGSTGGDDDQAPVVDKAYKVSIGTFVGGKVTADITETDEANQTITLTVTPDAQNGETMPYVLKAESLKVTLGTGEEATDVEVTPGDNNTYTFTMDTEGTYTVTAEFVQPIEKADVFVAANKATLTEKAVTPGYITEEDLSALFDIPDEDIDEAMQKNPWLVIVADRSTDYDTEDHKISVADVTVTQNGVAPTGEDTVKTTDFGKMLSIIVNTPSENADKQDYLGYTNDYGTYEVSFTYEGAEYSFTTEYAPEGTVKATYQDSKSDEVYATHVGKTEDKLTPPTVTKDGYTFTGWNSQADGSGDPLTPDTTTYENGTTWYAQWKADEYTVTYNRENGDWVEGFEPTTTYTIESETIALPTAADITRDGYTFAGWKNEQGETVTEIPTGSTGHITLTAQWTADAATVEEMEELLKNALTTQWEDDFTYTHEAEIAGTTVNYGAYPNEFVDAKEEEGHTIATADLARFLGGIYQSMDPAVQESASITYGKDTYNWNADKGNTGSNWYKDDTSLVSALTLDIAEGLEMSPPYTEAPVAGAKSTFVLTINGVDVTFNINVIEPTTAVEDLENLQKALQNANLSTVNITKDMAIPTGSSLEIPEGKTVNVQEGATLTIGTESEAATFAEGGTLTVNGTLNVAGTVKVLADAKVTIAESGAVQVAEGATLTNNGTVAVAENATLINNGTLTNDGTLDAMADNVVNNGTVGGKVTTVDREISAATIHDHSDAVADENLATEYSATAEKNLKDGVTTIKIKATELKLHQNANGSVGYWVGAFLPAPEDTDWNSVKYSKDGSKYDDLNQSQADYTDDNGEYLSYYVNADGTETTFDFYVAWDGNTGNVEHFVLDVSEVELAQITALTAESPETAGDYTTYTLKNGDTEFPVTNDKVKGFAKGTDGAITMYKIVEHQDSDCPAEAEGAQNTICMVSSEKATPHEKGLTVKKNFTGTYYLWDTTGNCYSISFTSGTPVSE